jgi:adenosylmethionine-8-amino-7-oxononanoate aminotransferase
MTDISYTLTLLDPSAESSSSNEQQLFNMAHPFVSNSNLLHRSFARRPEKAISASGVSLFLESGREVLDASAGPAVSCLGFGRPEITKVVVNQMNRPPYLYSGARFTCDATEDLASMLLEGHSGGLSKAIFVNSGSEATDAAIKLATQYWHEQGMPQKHHFIARKQSYHGNTIGALCVSGHDSRRAMYCHSLSHNVSFVDPCFAYRLKEDEDEDDEAYIKRLADQVEAEILRVGPENVSAFVAETVSGTTLGCVPAVSGYFEAIRQICDKYDVLLILDEASSYSYWRSLITNFAHLRLCVVWERLAPCMLGSRRTFLGQISR